MELSAFFPESSLGKLPAGEYIINCRFSEKWKNYHIARIFLDKVFFLDLHILSK